MVHLIDAQACCILELCCRAVAPGHITGAPLNASTVLAIVFAICVAAIPKREIVSDRAKKSREQLERCYLFHVRRNRCLVRKGEPALFEQHASELFGLRPEHAHVDAFDPPLEDVVFVALGVDAQLVAGRVLIERGDDHALRPLHPPKHTQLLRWLPIGRAMAAEG